MFALHLADVSSSSLSLVAPPSRPVTLRRPLARPPSGALLAASRASAGLVRRAPPPGTIGTRTLAGILWVFFGVSLLRYVLAGWL